MLKLSNIQSLLKINLHHIFMLPLVGLLAVLNHEYNMVYIYANSEVFSVATTCILIALPFWYYVESNKDTEVLTSIICGIGIIINFLCLASTSTAYMGALLGTQFGSYFYANVAILYTSIIFIGNLALLAIHFAYKFVRKEFFSTPRKKPTTPASTSYPASHQGASSANQNATQRGGFVANPNLQGGLQRIPEHIQDGK